MRTVFWTFVFFAICQHSYAALPDRLQRKHTCQNLRPTLNDLVDLDDPRQYNPFELAQWLKTKHRTKGVVVMTHGLNLRPSRMDRLSDLFNEWGFDVLRVALRGHRGSIYEMTQVNRRRWQMDFYASYCVAKKRATRLDVPILFFGYSLGGAMGLDLMTQEMIEPVRFERAILFAPAIAVRTYTYLIKALFVFSDEKLIPSKAPKDYRANSGTSIGAYRALFQTIRAIKKRDRSAFDIPTLVMVDPDDELVSLGGLKNFADSQKQWTVEEVDASQTELKKSYRHLIIDPPSVGQKEWQRMKRLLHQHVKPLTLNSK